MAASMARRLAGVFLSRNRNCVQLFVCRTLLSDSDTKLEGYLRQRIFLSDLLGHAGKASLMYKLADVKTPEDAKCSAIQIADFIHLAETSQEVLELERVFQLISVCHAIDSFKFGASLLRMYHHLGLPDRAFKMYKNPVSQKLLSDNTCHKILMDLLYKHQQYQQVLDVYTSLQTFNIDCVTLVFGAHYHINTPESCKMAQKLVKDILRQYILSKRALLFVVMLYINQNNADAALEILRKLRSDNFVLNFSLITYAKLGHIPDILKCLETAVRKASDITKPLNIRLYIDTMNNVRQAVNNTGSQNSLQKFHKLEQTLSLLGALSPQKITWYLDKTIFGERSNLKESGKRGIIRGEQ